MTGSRSGLSGQVCSSQEYTVSAVCTRHLSLAFDVVVAFALFCVALTNGNLGQRDHLPVLLHLGASLVEACVDGSQLIITYFGETDFFCSIL